jgi:nucleotide-binding universal stress UspA family protein
MNACPLSPRRLLVPLDRSECARAALDPARAIAERSGAEVILVSVIERARVLEAHPLFKEDVADDMRRSHQQMLDEAARRSFTGLPVRCIVVIGDVESEIVRLAKREAADLIVMGTHEWKGLRHGYVEGIVRHAPCAVLTLKH